MFFALKPPISCLIMMNVLTSGFLQTSPFFEHFSSWSFQLVLQWVLLMHSAPLVQSAHFVQTTFCEKCSLSPTCSCGANCSFSSTCSYGQPGFRVTLLNVLTIKNNEFHVFCIDQTQKTTKRDGVTYANKCLYFKN